MDNKKCQKYLKFTTIIILVMVIFTCILPTSIYAATPNTISIRVNEEDEELRWSYITSPYDILTEDFGDITFKGTDDSLEIPFSSLSWMARSNPDYENGMVSAARLTGGGLLDGLTLSSGDNEFIDGKWFVFGTNDRSTKFAFKSMKIGEYHGMFDTAEIIGLRNGIQVATQIVGGIPRYNIFTKELIFKDVILNEDFSFVDEIRIRQKTEGIYNGGIPGFDGIIVNDFVLDAPFMPFLGFENANYSVIENAGAVTLNVTRAENLSVPLTIDYSTQNGTAVSGTDYTATNGTLAFASGDTIKTISIPITDTSSYEGSRSFTVILSNPSEGGISETGTATITIEDDELPDTTPPVWIDTYPNLGNITKNSLEILVQTDEGSTAYFVCLPLGSNEPSVEQVKAGLDASNNEVNANQKGSVTIAAATEGAITAEGLAPGTQYDIYLVAEDIEPNIQNEVVKVQGTTAPVTSIEILTPPTKVAYKVGEELDLTGLLVKVNYGDGSTENIGVTAENITGFDNSTANPSQTLTINIGGQTTDFTISLEYEYFTLTYMAGENGSLTGESSQSVIKTTNGNPVTAMPNSGYHFLTWNDGITTATRTDNNIVADVTVTAEFAINTYNLRYQAGSGGSISGDADQTINHGMSGTPVTAVPDSGYHFLNWNDGITTSGRNDINIQSDLEVTADFQANLYQVSFVTNCEDTLDVQQLLFSSYIDEPNSLTKAGYALEGWYRDDAFVTPWDFSTDTVPAEDITLYAHWIVDQDAITMAGTPQNAIISDNFDQEIILNISNDTIIGSLSNTDFSLAGVLSDLDVEILDNTTNSITIRIYGELTSTGQGTITFNEEKLQNRTTPLATQILIKSAGSSGGGSEESSGGNSAPNQQEPEKVPTPVEKNDEKIVEVKASNQGSAGYSALLSKDTMDKMEKAGQVLSIKTDTVNYVIPGKEIGLENIAQKLGLSSEKLDKIEVEVKIVKVDESLSKKIEESANLQGCEILFPPVSFEITARVTTNEGEDRVLNLSKFNNYVQRVIEIPVGVDPEKITTGIVYNDDGTLSHVPTVIFSEGGKYFAQINSLTNSSYSLIWNPITVKSVENHWSKKTVNNLAAKMVIFNPESFEPDEKVTRADFAEYIVRALGLYREGTKYDNKFSDVNEKNERLLGILIAENYGIVAGYDNGTFRPDALITREEAMAIFERAMKITKLEGADKDRYKQYSDFDKVSGWVESCVKEVLAARIFNGTSENVISPKANLTYAETAQAIQNLLVESKLIN